MCNARELMRCCLYFTAGALAREMSHRADRAFATTGLTPTQAFALLCIAAEPGVHPSEIAYDIHTMQRSLEALDHHPAFGVNFDPSHAQWQGLDPVKLIDAFADRIWHVHMKDCATTLDGTNSILGGHMAFGDHRRGWDFRSPGRGDVDFEAIIRALNRIGYKGPLSVEWEDSVMDREHGASEAVDFVRGIDFPAAGAAFDSAFDKEQQ